MSFLYVALGTQFETGDTRLPFRRAGAIFSPLVFLSPKDLTQPLLFPSLSSAHVIAFMTITVAHVLSIFLSFSVIASFAITS